MKQILENFETKFIDDLYDAEGENEADDKKIE